MSTYSSSLLRLEKIMQELRSKCPWDKKQTIHTLRQLTIEETYELTDAITETNWQGIKEELGDILLHILFYSTIAEEEGQFTLRDVIETICNKLINRHPHIYEQVSVESDEDVKRNWENLKLKEGKKSILSGVPKGLPAMVKALRMQEKAKQVGFEWEETIQVKNKVLEELAELEEAVAGGKQEEINHEFGDLFFSLINLARFLHVDPENALELTNKKFMKRFIQMETKMVSGKKQLSDYSLQEMDSVWNEIKQDEKK